MENLDLEMYQTSVIYLGIDSIALKPLCDFFGIDYGNQLARIKKDENLNELCGKNHTVALDGKHRSMISLTKWGFLMWIYGLNPKIVVYEKRDMFIRFKRNLNAYLLGSVQKMEVAKVQYHRLAKLKKLYSKIGLEIQRSEKEVKEYIDEHLQLKLEFKEPPQIE